MEFNKQKFSLAAAIAAGTAYMVCAVFTALLPGIALNFLGWMAHLTNVEKIITVQITLTGFILGLLPILLYAYFTAYVFALLYNKFVQSRT